MHTGRKILNLRCDRRISQQDLARACQITPSALSKIEAGINSPRANIIWRIAQNLGVTVEYLLDESIPYPYPAYKYRQTLLDRKSDPETKVRREISLEEEAFLDDLRQAHPVSRETALGVPGASLEAVRLVHFILHHSTVADPDPTFWKNFRSLVTTGTLPGAEPRGEKAKRASPKAAARPKSRTRKKTSRKKKTSRR